MQPYDWPSFHSFFQIIYYLYLHCKLSVFFSALKKLLDLFTLTQTMRESGIISCKPGFYYSHSAQPDFFLTEAPKLRSPLTALSFLGWLTKGWQELPIVQRIKTTFCCLLKVISTKTSYIPFSFKDSYFVASLLWFIFNLHPGTSSAFSMNIFFSHEVGPQNTTSMCNTWRLSSQKVYPPPLYFCSRRRKMLSVTEPGG